jgi:hypothetical protein
VKTHIVTLLLISIFSLTSQALEVRSGKYVRAKGLFVNVGQDGIPAVPEADFAISRRGNIVNVTDLHHNIVYEMDLNRRDEQHFPQAFFDYFHKREDVGAIGSILKDVTIDQIVETQDRLTARVNLYIESVSVFGKLSARLSFSGEAISDQCEVNIFNSVKGGQTTSKENCFRITTGRQAGATALQIEIGGVSPPPIIVNTAGVVMDFVIKVLPVYNTSMLMKIPRF